MLLLCEYKLSPKCIPTRSGYTRSAGVRQSMCPYCRAVAVQSPALREITVQDMLNGGKQDVGTYPTRLRSGT